MPRNEESILIRPDSKHRVTYYLGQQTLNRVDYLAETMSTPKSSVIDKAIEVYTDLVVKEQNRNERKKDYGTS
jgi:predicted transcriptional regulator